MSLLHQALKINICDDKSRRSLNFGRDHRISSDVTNLRNIYIYIYIFKNKIRVLSLVKDEVSITT
jgi:hypothetical protein